MQTVSNVNNHIACVSHPMLTDSSLLSALTQWQRPRAIRKVFKAQSPQRGRKSKCIRLRDLNWRLDLDLQLTEPRGEREWAWRRGCKSECELQGEEGGSSSTAERSVMFGCVGLEIVRRARGRWELARYHGRACGLTPLDGGDTEL